MQLRLSRAQWQALVEQVARELPNEACGLLGGREGVVERVCPVVNIRRSPVEYEFDPVQQVETMTALEAAGLELTGIYHSHPRGPAVPSAMDVALAYYPESLYVILAPDAMGAWHGRAFRIEDGSVTEVPLFIE